MKESIRMYVLDYEWVAENPEFKAILTVRDNPDKFVDSWLYQLHSWKFWKCTHEYCG
jgi:hypothetical protein